MHVVNTSRMTPADFVSTFQPTAAEAATEVGADQAARSYTSKKLDLGPMQMLAPLLVASVLGIVGFVALLAWGLR